MEKRAIVLAFYTMFYLKRFFIYSFNDQLFGVQGARLLRDWRSGETLKGAKRQGAHRLPRGKRASWSGKQLLTKASMHTKR
ncbi:hypothetical protein IHV12_10315 [Fictibacillus sp. 7GRE50]|uniref:hypothetical protein n=1 Tax=Fictibacillus sp. 7GRE50 TaxID=2745878 RepID=UPI0018CCF7E7|nr:hypothetical protein [Fictibacillus sp. 7GRE50]MBH0165318.1 hypothetical protein [Fictibacillus sp. 7GRE50]